MLANTFGALAQQPLPEVDGKAEHVGLVAMPQLRVGIHCGIVNMTLLRIQSALHFDVLGAHMSTAVRIHSASRPQAINMSIHAKENVEKYDVHKIFEFTAPHNVLVRHVGTVACYYLLTADVRIPRDLFRLLGVREARRRIVYGTAKCEDIDRGSESQLSAATYE